MKCQLCDGDGIVRNVTAALSGNDVCPHCHGSGLEPKGHDKQFDKRDQECWLIERFVNGHTEWFSGWANDAYGLNAGPSSEWVADVFKAVRFVRAEDARAVMQNQGERFHLSKPVAHLWFTPPQQEKVCWRKPGERRRSLHAGHHDYRHDADFAHQYLRRQDQPACEGRRPIQDRGRRLRFAGTGPVLRNVAGGRCVLPACWWAT